MSFFSIAKGFHKLSSHPPPELTHKELGRLDKALDQAQKQGWTVVDMKKDWNTVFPSR